MSSLVTYKLGVKVLSPEPSGAGGIGLNTNFRTVADLIEAAQTLIGTKADTTSLTAHTSNTSNPHSVTAAQTGAYTSAQTDTLLTGKANTSHTHAASDVISGTFSPSLLGTGSPSSSTVLSGDGTWKLVSALDIHV